MTTTLGISHIGLGVKDLDRSVHFYKEILGLKVVHEVEYDEMPEILRHPERPSKRAVYLRAGEGERAAVVVLGTIDRENQAGPILFDDLGINHFSIWVDDIRALHQRLVDAGVEVILQPVDVDSYQIDQGGQGRDGGPCATMMFRDPDGFMLQADERLPSA